MRGVDAWGSIMMTYVALLRGINVGGRSRVVMADLRKLFEDLGHADVRTYVQSGNVIFRAADEQPAMLERAIEARIEDVMGASTTVLLRTAAEVARVASNNPYLGREDDVSKLHVTFLAAEPAPERAARLVPPPGQPEELALVGREVYLLYPNGYGRSKLTNAYIERRLGVAATNRNWNTVTKLRDLACG